MINKKSLWFLTLFSLILVLSVYYITMPSELLLTSNNSTSTTTENEKETPLRRRQLPRSAFGNGFQASLHRLRQRIYDSQKQDRKEYQKHYQRKGRALAVFSLIN